VQFAYMCNYVATYRCVYIYNVKIQCRVVDKSVRIALVWGDGPGDSWVMGHMRHGSSAQWVTWVMGHSE